MTVRFQKFNLTYLSPKLAFAVNSHPLVQLASFYSSPVSTPTSFTLSTSQVRLADSSHLAIFLTAVSIRESVHLQVGINLLLNYASPTTLTATVDEMFASRSNLNAIGFHYIVADQGALAVSQQARFWAASSVLDIRSSSVTLPNDPNFPFGSLQANSFYGLSGYSMNKVANNYAIAMAASVTGMTISVSGNPKPNYVGYSLLIFHSYQCSPPFYSTFGQCFSACASNQQVDNINRCWTYCEPGPATWTCKQCVVSNYTCLTCIRTFQLGSTCVSSCPAYTYPDAQTSTCPACEWNCQQCDAASCWLCDPNYMVVGRSCSLACPASHYLSTNSSNSQMVCSPCSLDKCIKVTNFSFRYMNPQKYPYSTLLLEIRLSRPVDSPQSLAGFVVRPSSSLSIQFGMFNSTAVYFQISSSRVEIDLNVSAYLKSTELVRGLQGEPLEQATLVSTANFTMLGNESINLGLSKPSEWVMRFSNSLPPEIWMMTSVASTSLQTTSSFLYLNLSLPRIFFDALRLLSLGNYYRVPRPDLTPTSRPILGRELHSNVEASIALSKTFLLNVYPQLFILAAAMLIAAGVHVLARQGKLEDRRRSLSWVVLDYAHEYIGFYLFLGLALQFNEQHEQSLLERASIGIIVLMALEYLGYQLYRFNRLLGLVHALPTEEQFSQLLVLFSHQLRWLRFEETKHSPMLQPFLSPDFYPFTSSIKKNVSLLALGLFRDQLYWQLGLLFAIELLHIARTAYVSPYSKAWLNRVHLALELAVVLMLALLAVAHDSFRKLKGLPLGQTSSYDVLGWCLLVLLVLYNLTLLCLYAFRFHQQFQVSNIDLVKDYRTAFSKSPQLELSQVPMATLQVKSLSTSERMRRLQQEGCVQSSQRKCIVELEYVSLSRQNGRVQVSITRALKLKQGKKVIYRKSNLIRANIYRKTLWLDDIKDSRVNCEVRALLRGLSRFEVRTMVTAADEGRAEGDVLTPVPLWQEVAEDGVLTRLEGNSMLPLFPISLKLIQRIQLLTKVK